MGEGEGWEAGCVGERREHNMALGGRQDVWMGGGSTKWELAGGRTRGWEGGRELLPHHSASSLVEEKKTHRKPTYLFVFLC